MKSFTVITPCYNAEKYIEKCINAIASMNYDMSKVQHIIVDDGSTDKTANICNELSKKYKHIQFLTKKNGNWGSVINYVRSNNLITNDYVVICDADDFLHKDAFSIVDKKCNNSDLVVGCYRTFCGNKTSLRYSNYFYLFKRSIQRDENLKLFFAPAIVPTCIYIKKDIFNKSTKLVENVMYQDSVLYASCFAISNSLKCIYKTISYYQKNQTNNTMAQRFTEKGKKSFITRFNNWVEFESPEIMSYDIIFNKGIYKWLKSENLTFTFNKKPCFKVFPLWIRFWIWLSYKIKCKKIIIIKDN